MDSTSTAAVLLLNLPDKALGGIDLLSFTTTRKFKGIKNLPSGFHFIFTGSTSSLSVRHGVWIKVEQATTASSSLSSSSPPDLFIKKWDTSTESLLPETDVAQILHWRANLGAIWREGLTPYRQSATSHPPFSSSTTAAAKPTSPEYENNDWALLTSHITPSLLTRVLGSDPNHWTLTSASSARVDIDDIPGLSVSEIRSADERDLLFLPINLKQTWREGATGRERTDAAQDRSWYLSDLISRHIVDDNNNKYNSTNGNANWNQVLGELEFCFLMVLTLNNYSCLEQWRRILSLLLTCNRAILEMPDFFVNLFATLRLQLSHCGDVDGGEGSGGGGLFDLSDEGATFLKPLMLRFAKTLEALAEEEEDEEDEDGNGGAVARQDVEDEFEDLMHHLSDVHGWRFPERQRRQQHHHHHHDEKRKQKEKQKRKGPSFARSGLLTLEDGEQVDLDDTTHDLDDEEGEYAPLVVDLSAEQLRLLGFDDDDDDDNGLVETASPEALARRGGGGGAAKPVEKSLRQTIRDQDAEEESSGEEEEGLYEDDGDFEDMDARY